MIAGMCDCRLQMVVISVPASGDDNPMLILHGESPSSVAHLVRFSFCGALRGLVSGDAARPPLDEKAHEVCCNVAFYIWNI